MKSLLRGDTLMKLHYFLVLTNVTLSPTGLLLYYL